MNVVTFDWEEKFDATAHALAVAKARGQNIVITDAAAAAAMLRPQMATKRHYKGPSKAAALEFLKANPVDRPLYTLVVHTPEGIFGVDKDGIFEQPKV